MTTALQNQMIQAIALSEFQPINGQMPKAFSDLDFVWADCIIETAEDKGVFTSLVNAGLAKHCGNKGRDASVALTEKGYEVFLANNQLKQNTRKLIATFSEATYSVEHSITMMDKRTGSATSVSVVRVDDNSCMVVGNAQDVMFIIGEVAAGGSEGLLSVSVA